MISGSRKAKRAVCPSRLLEAPRALQRDGLAAGAEGAKQPEASNSLLLGPEASAGLDDAGKALAPGKGVEGERSRSRVDVDLTTGPDASDSSEVISRLTNTLFEFSSGGIGEDNEGEWRTVQRKSSGPRSGRRQKALGAPSRHSKARRNADLRQLGFKPVSASQRRAELAREEKQLVRDAAAADAGDRNARRRSAAQRAERKTKRQKRRSAARRAEREAERRVRRYAKERKGSLQRAIRAAEADDSEDERMRARIVAMGAASGGGGRLKRVESAESEHSSDSRARGAHSEFDESTSGTDHEVAPEVVSSSSSSEDVFAAANVFDDVTLVDDDGTESSSAVIAPSMGGGSDAGGGGTGGAARRGGP